MWILWRPVYDGNSDVYECVPRHVYTYIDRRRGSCLKCRSLRHCVQVVLKKRKHERGVASPQPDSPVMPTRVSGTVVLGQPAQRAVIIEEKEFARDCLAGLLWRDLSASTEACALTQMCC